jgi:hypothetical protein
MQLRILWASHPTQNRTHTRRGLFSRVQGLLIHQGVGVDNKSGSAIGVKVTVGCGVGVGEKGMNPLAAK